MRAPSRRALNTAVTVLSLSLISTTFSLGATSASAVEPDAYLQDYTEADGEIRPSDGNFSGAYSDECGFSWSAQSVIDTDLSNYSTNGFLETVNILESERPGSGYIQIQHWYSPGTGQLNWRIPIALTAPLTSSRVEMVFDDPDWTPNVDTFKQYSPWTSQPGYESAFHRFTGITGFVPHDDSRVTPFEWGTNEEGYTTLAFDLGEIEAGTSTVLQFSGTPVDGLTGVENGTSYGAKLTLNGEQPLATCFQPNYKAVEVLTGDTANQTPTFVLEGSDGEPADFPEGTKFELLADYTPEGMTINESTGEITWPVPADAYPGSVIVPVTVTYPDNAEFIEGSIDETQFEILIKKEPRLGPFDDQTVQLGRSIIDVVALLKDHLGLPYGLDSALSVEGLPEGVTFDPETGIISGTPGTVGVYPVIVRGLDQDGEELISESFTITVVDEAVVDPPTEKPEDNDRPKEPTDTDAPDSDESTSEVLASTGTDNRWGAGLIAAIGAALGGLLLVRRKKHAHEA